MLVERVRAGALGAEAVEDGDADGGDEVAVRTAAGRSLLEPETELEAVLARSREELRAAFRALERRTRPAAVDRKGRALERRLERGQRPLRGVSVLGTRDAYGVWNGCSPAPSSVRPRAVLGPSRPGPDSSPLTALRRRYHR